MDPKLLRMYSDILNEQGFAQQYALRNTEDPRITAARQQATASAPAPGTAAAVRGGRGGTGPVSAPQAAKPTAPLPGNPNAPAYTKDPGQTKKVGTGASGFPVAGQGGRPTPTKPPAPAIDPRVASARAADAARQAAAPAPGTTQDPSGGQGNRAFLPGAAGGAKPETPAAQTTPDQMRTTSAVGASNIGFTGPETPATAAAPAPAPVTGQSSYTSQTGAELGKTGAGSSGYTDTAGLSGIDSGGQAARPTTQGPAVTSSSGAPVTSGSGAPVTTRDFNQPQFGSLGNRLNEFELEEELEEEVEESVEKELDEAFNEMLRLSGIQLNEKAPPGAKAERMVKHIKKGYAKDGKLSDKEKSIAFATAWKAKKAGKLDEGFRVMMDEEGHTLEHIVNRFKHEAKTFLNTGEMSDKLYDALYDYYLDRGEMPYGIAKAREGDPYTWVAARFEADIDGTVDVKMPLGEVGGDDTLNELARLAGLSESRAEQGIAEGSVTSDVNVKKIYDDGNTKEWHIYRGKEMIGYVVKNLPDTAEGLYIASGHGPGRGYTEEFNGLKSAVKYITSLDNQGVAEGQVNECGDMGMDMEDRLNVSTNMSSDGTKSVNISAQGEKAEELLSMLKLAGMGGRDRPVVAMIDRDEEMMDEDRPIEYPNTPREKYDNIETQFIGGDGEVAGKEKRMHAGGSARFSDNPLAVDEMLGEEWSALYDSILIKKEMEEGSIKGGDKPGELTGTWSADPPKKGQPNVPPPVPMDPVYPAEKPKATSTPGIKR